MGDYTWMEVHIVDWGPDPAKVMLELATYGFEEPDVDDPDRYVQEEGRVGNLDSLITTLPATGASFYGWECPKYEWLGTYIAHTPELGSFAAPCDDGGTVVLSWGELRGRNVASSPTLDQAFGRPWETALSNMTRKATTP